MDVSNDEIQRSVRKWLAVTARGEELPVVLMPFDPEGKNEYDPDFNALWRSGQPTQ